MESNDSFVLVVAVVVDDDDDIWTILKIAWPVILNVVSSIWNFVRPIWVNDILW